jgi:predicted TIM-barrel fold metal-dependent hydrolase
MGYHPSVFQTNLQHPEISSELQDPYVFARKRGLPVNSLDDYLALLDRIFTEAKAGDCVCLKSTLAYNRTLRFENVPKERAAVAFGRPRSEVTPDQVKDFEDFLMWHVTAMSARYEMPFQIHTGDADLQCSNPMLLVNLIEANPHTKFELFHGGYPWTREYGAIGNKYPQHVWLNCTWLPTFGREVAVDAFRQWLDVVPSNRLNWGGDDATVEGIYGAAEMNRQCWAEALAERVDRGDLDEPEAKRVGKQILRDNALELYPRFQGKLWKST